MRTSHVIASLCLAACLTDGSAEAVTANPHLTGLSVKACGATGDGVTDDTTAVQACFVLSASVYFPAGTYVVSNVTLVEDGANVFGDGVASVLSMKAGATGPMVDAGTLKVNIRDLALFGGSVGSYKGSSSTGTRDGLSLQPSRDSHVHGVSFYGFTRTALVLASQAADRLTHLNVDSCQFYNSWQAINAAISGGSEYVRMENLDINNNYYGLRIGAGNFLGSNMKINDNGIGVYVTNAVGNDGHGNVNSSLINHNTTAIFAENISNGFNFVGNCIFQGDIHFSGSTGVQIYDGIVDATSYHFENGGINYIRNNFDPGGYGGTITHSGDGTLFVDDWKADGTFIEKRHTVIVVDP